MSTSRTREKADGELFKSTGIDDNATSTAVTIDASENVMVGKSAISGAVAGCELRSDGYGLFTRSASPPLQVRRLASDGELAYFYKDSTLAGSINTRVGNLSIGSGDVSLEFNDPNDALLPSSTATNNTRDAAVNLGISSVRFKDLYLSGGVYLGGTGAANKLDDYEEGTWTPSVTGTTGGTVNSYHNRAGRYIKIGNQVTLWFYFHTQSVSGMSGTAKINGLPFSFTSDVANNAGMGTVSAYYLNDSSLRDINLVHSGANSIGLLGSASSNGISGNDTWANVAATAFSGTALKGVFTYRSS